MSFLVILGISVGLAIDAMSVAIATSLMLGRVTAGQVFRFAFSFGLFQGVMPILGWYAGREIEVYIRDFDHWVAFALLAAIGAKGIIESFRSDGDSAITSDPTKGVTLLVLSVATSIDALAVGLNFGILEQDIWFPALVIGVVTAGLTIAGMLLSRLITDKARRSMQVFGGLVLIAIGIKILVEHLSG